MKKRMLLSTVLMTLVLLLAVTTATFAWYQATSQGISVSNNNTSVSTTDAKYQIGGVTFDVTWAAINDTCEELTDASGNVYYIYNGTKVLKSVDASAKYGTAVISSIKLAASAKEGDPNYNLPEGTIASLAGNYEITVTATSTGNRLCVSNSAGVATSNTCKLSCTIDSNGNVTITSANVYFSIRPQYDNTTNTDTEGSVGTISVTSITRKSS